MSTSGGFCIDFKHFLGEFEDIDEKILPILPLAIRLQRIGDTTLHSTPNNFNVLAKGCTLAVNVTGPITNISTFMSNPLIIT
ncbi:MAG: hypothetical protein IAX21_01315 [Candidatus Bathyarchaeota archaeon]|nr:MAG: hypothetical protein IAX21_01315 [Candidatus Bathyarchaeota archaeon]